MLSKYDSIREANRMFFRPCGLAISESLQQFRGCSEIIEFDFDCLVITYGTRSCPKFGFHAKLSSSKNVVIILPQFQILSAESGNPSITSMLVSDDNVIKRCSYLE